MKLCYELLLTHGIWQVDFTFQEVEEDGGEVGELRVAYTDEGTGAAAFAYAPGSSAVSGDIWFEAGSIDITWQ